MKKRFKLVAVAAVLLVARAFAQGKPSALDELFAAAGKGNLDEMQAGLWRAPNVNFELLDILEPQDSAPTYIPAKAPLVRVPNIAEEMKSPRGYCSEKERDYTVDDDIRMVLEYDEVILQDFNKDGKINCIDRAIAFKLTWDDLFGGYSYYYCQIIHNYNPGVLDHLFVRVKYFNYGWVYVEPSSSSWSVSYDMKNVWRSQYNPACNSGDETDKWLSICKGNETAQEQTNRKKEETKKEEVSREDSKGVFDGRYKTLSFTVPVMNRKFDGDDGDAKCSFEAVGMGYDYSSYKDISPFVTLFRAGFAMSGLFATPIFESDSKMGGGTLKADYGSNEAELEHVFDLMLYARIGFGYAFESSRWAFIPAIGVGSTFDYRYARYEMYDARDDYSNFYGSEITLDVFASLLWAFEAYAEWSLALGIEISSPVCGAGKFTELGSYSVDGFSTLNFLPMVSFCRRFF